MDGKRRRFDCATPLAKDETYDALYCWLRGMPHEAELDAAIGAIAAEYGIDAAAQCRALCMGWEELAGLAADPLVTIGSHTVSHPFLAKCDAEAARREMTESRFDDRSEARRQAGAFRLSGRRARTPPARASSRLRAELGYKTARDDARRASSSPTTPTI